MTWLAVLARLRPRDLFSLWLGGGGSIAGLLAVSLALAGHFAGAVLVLLTLPVGAALAAPLLRLARKPKAQPQAALLGQVHDVLGDLVVTRDMDRRILYANRVFKQLTGLMKPEGRTLEDIGVILRPGPAPHRYDLELATTEGQKLFLWHDIVTRDEKSGGLILHSIGRDVTAEYSAAEAEREERLRAERNSAAKSRLLATVSHEIRTPLSGILGMSYLLGQNKLSPEQRNYLSGIEEAGQALNQLVEDLLDYSTIEVGRFELRPQSAPLRPLLENVVEMLAHRAHEKNIEIGATVAANVPERLDLDAARLRQVLFNVIGNAVKFTEKGGVAVSVGLDGGDLVIRVTDSGPGMTREEQSRVFGEYEQGGTILQKSAGTGLGLSISAQIIREFGGSITVSSRKGSGSTFAIRFRAVPAEGKAPTRRERLLFGSNVVLLAPAGPARVAVAETIRTLGGICHAVDDGMHARETLLSLSARHMPPTDLIVDHRVVDEFHRHLADDVEIANLGLRRVLLVNPEARARHALDLFDAWLIRPLREQSLIDVLRGRMRGVEKRDALNDNAPTFVASLAPALPAGGLSILFGEDDPINAALVRAVLEKGGHRVHHVEDFETLLDHAMSGSIARPDIIITDLSMPGGDGIEMLARLRAHERRHDLVPHPVIVLTAERSDESRRQALLNGANRVMIKPVDPIRLLTEIQAVAALSARRAEAK